MDMETFNTLLTLAAVLCAGLIALSGVVFIKVIMGDFDTKRIQATINSDGAKSADNIYTRQAAEEHAKAALANKEAAQLNLQAEELRNERLGLTKSG